jgi:hypothetical protein
MRTTVEIVRETKKAKLVRNGEQQAWLPNRWIRDDLTVKSETFNKSAAEFLQTETSRKEIRDFKNSHHSVGSIIRETEKAVAVRATIYEECSDQEVTRLAWFPKSQIKNAQAPGWLFLAKAKDLLELVRMPVGGTYTVTISGMDFADYEI